MSYFPDIKRKTANIDIRVEPQLVKRIDAWRDQQRVRPSRSAAIVHMIEDFLERESITSRHPHESGY
jgi:metal-responsive CopG/Arc/MetJ family transcriptional regulator